MAKDTAESDRRPESIDGFLDSFNPNLEKLFIEIMYSSFREVLNV